MMEKLQGIVLLALSFASVPCSEAGITCNVPDVVISLSTTELSADLMIPDGETAYVAASYVTSDADLTAIPAECKGVVASSALTLSISDLHSCGAIATAPSLNYLVEYTVWYSAGLHDGTPPIYRPTHRSIKLTCVLPQDHSLSFGGKIVISTVTAQTMQSNEPGEFSIFLAAYTGYTDPNPTGALIPNDPITVPDPIYVQVLHMDSFADTSRFIVQMTDCYATSTNDPDASGPYEIITGGCEVTNAFEEAADAGVDKNYEPTDGVFHFNSFLWTSPPGDGQEIYLFCRVTICDSIVASGGCSAPTCSKKRKRRELTSDLSDEPRSGMSDHSVSFGPIVLAAEGQSCTENNGGCSDACSLVNTKVKCSCVANRVLASDGKTCLAVIEGTNDEVLQEMKATENAVYILMVMIVVVIAAAAGFFARSMCFNRKH